MNCYMRFVFFLSNVVWQMAAANKLFKIAVEGNRTELNCWTDSTYAVDWVLITAINRTRLDVYRDKIIPDTFKDHYSLESANDSKGESFPLSIRNIFPSHSGRYECVEGVSWRPIVKIELIVISPITCNLTAEEGVYLNAFCSFTVTGNAFISLEWNEDSNANDARWSCNGQPQDSCEVTLSFNDNSSVTQTLPVRFPGALQGHWTLCNVTSLDNDTLNDSWKNFTKVFRFKVRLECSQNSTTNLTTSAPGGYNELRDPWFVVVLVGPLSGSVLIFIIIVIAVKVVRFRRKKKTPMTECADASEFGTVRMIGNSCDENTVYEEINDFNDTQGQCQAVSYYNILAVEQKTQSSAAVDNSIPRSEETDYRVNNDGCLQDDGVAIYAECKRPPSGDRV